MKVDLFTERLAAPATIFIVGLALACLIGLIRKLAGNADLFPVKILQIQHSLNPLHVYCRLVDRGFNKKLSMSICKYYKIVVYSWLSWCTVVAVKICKPGTS